MWSHLYLIRLDFRMIPAILGLMGISLLLLSSYSVGSALDAGADQWISPLMKTQFKRFLMGWVIYFFCAGLDYTKLREWTWLLYILVLLSLFGLYFTDPIARVHRWYKIPLLGIGLQPSEYGKLVVVLALAWFLERKKSEVGRLSTAMQAGVVVGIPFLLILKQPDLGTALVLYPVTLVMFYFGGIHPRVVQILTVIGVGILAVILSIFLGLTSHEEVRPIATKVLKEYQYNRLDPDTHHQKASITAIAIGGVLGKGWRQGDYTAGGWLPMPATDSVFPAFGEEFGLLGLLVLLGLFYLIIYFGFQISAVAKDYFGCLLAAGVTVYLAVHVIVNVGMMCGLLPITGVPLVLITYGGSSIFTAMAALGILQSIYSRRFMF